VDPATGISYVSYYDVFSVGAGYVDLAAALANTDVAKGNAMSPMAVYDSKTGNVHIVPFAGSVWGTSSAWSNVAVYGPAQFSSLGNGAWSSANVAGSSVMWGANDSTGFSTIWSNSVMWGASGDYGSSVMWGANVNGGE
jgi:serine protease AprX